MDLRPGYKQTEIGVFPEDWDTRSLGALSAFITKGATPTTYGFSWEKVGISFLRSESITENGVDFTNSQKISGEAHRMLKRSEIRCGDILIAITGYVGRVAIYRSNEPANINQHVARIRIVSEEADAGFLFHWLTQRSVRRSFESITTGQAYPQISLKQVREAVVPLPPITEQRAISEALSDLDLAVDILWHLIAKKRDARTGVMQRLLAGETRLAGFSTPWQKKRLGDLGAFLKGAGVKRDDALSGHLPCVRYGEIYTTHHNVIREFSSYISRSVADGAKRIQFRDLLFAGSGETKAEIGKCVALAQDVEAYAGGDIIILRPKSGNPVFLGWLMNTPQVVRQKANFGQGDAVVHVSASALASIEVSLPDLDEQDAIARVITDMDAEITVLEARLEKTRALKQGMMQALLTGRVRLPIQAEALDALEVAHA